MQDRGGLMLRRLLQRCEQLARHVCVTQNGAPRQQHALRRNKICMTMCSIESESRADNWPYKAIALIGSPKKQALNSPAEKDAGSGLSKSRAEKYQMLDLIISVPLQKTTTLR